MSPAADVTFSATPSYINPPFTESLKIRCTVGDGNSTISAPVTGRREVSDIVQPQFRRQVNADLSYITSIVVIRTNHTTGANETVATVTSFDPPTAHTDLDRLIVNGTTQSSTPGEKGFLELFWHYPTGRQYGIYTCEVFGLNSESHPEEITEAVQVGINEPSTSELLLYIGDLENRVAKLETNIGGTPTTANVQTGIVTCAQGTHDYSVVFPKPYNNRVPTTITALAGSQSSDAYTYLPSILHLSGNGFTLRCTSFQTTEVVWVAL